MDKDPKLRHLREKAERTYEKTPDSQPFQSRRPSSYENFYQDLGAGQEDFQESRWLRKFK